MSIPRFSRLLNTLEQLILRLHGYIIFQFKVKGVQVLNTTPNLISYKQLFSNTSCQPHPGEGGGYNHRNAIRDKLETCVDPLMSPKAIILSTLSPERSATKMSMLKTLFRFEKSSCKNLSRLVPQDSTKQSRGRSLP